MLKCTLDASSHMNALIETPTDTAWINGINEFSSSTREKHKHTNRGDYDKHTLAQLVTARTKMIFN